MKTKRQIDISNFTLNHQQLYKRYLRCAFIVPCRKFSKPKKHKSFTGKEQDRETGLYYYGARYLDPKTSRWLSGDPAMGDYIPGAPVNEEAKKRNGNLPGQGGVFNYVNLHTYHYAGNNPVKYTDPDGEKFGFFPAYYNMSNFRSTLLGNSTDEHISDAGCYITTFANIGMGILIGKYAGFSDGYGSDQKSSLLGINNIKSIFRNNTGDINESALNSIFGENRTDYYTKDGQEKNGGLVARLSELDASDKRYMIAGVFDLSSVEKNAENHMVGITGLPGKDGVFESSSIVPSSNGDRIRLNSGSKTAYNIDNLKQIIVILLD